MKAFGIALLFLQLNFSSFAVAQEPADDNRVFDIVKEMIVAALVDGLDSYSVCEHVDRANEPSYVAKLIPATEIPTSDAAVLARYFVVHKQADSGTVDFALYRVRFASHQEAMRAVSLIRTGPTGTVADGKALTRYAVRLYEDSIYIIRTTSLLDPLVQAFLESFSKKDLEIR